MNIRRLILLSLTFGALALVSAPQAQAWPDHEPPKPLPDSPLLQQQQQGKPKKDPYKGLSKELFELRKKTKEGYVEWQKEDLAVQKFCAAADSVVTRAQCDQKKRLSQAKFEIVQAKTRDMLKKVDTYRRQKAGLPPPPWWNDEPARRGSNTAPSMTGGQGAPKVEKPLVPQNSSPVPQNTY